MHSEAVYVGLDIGAHKTSVVSSQGHRAVFGSAVGWSKGCVGPTAVEQNVVFGEHAIAQGHALQVVKPFAEEFVVSSTTRNSVRSVTEHQQVQNAARWLIEHGVSQVHASSSLPVFGTLGVSARASQAFKLAMLEACTAAFATTLLVPAPLAVAYSLQHVDGTLVVDIGEDVTSLYAVPEACLREESQVFLPIGGRTLDERIIEQVRSDYPDAEINHAIAREIKERFGYQGDQQRRVVVMLNSSNGCHEHDLTEALNNACRSFAELLAESILEETAKLGILPSRAREDHLLLAGGGSRLRGIDTLLEGGISKKCPVRVSRVQDGVFAAATGALQLAMDAPHDCWAALHQLDRDCFAA